MAAAHDTNGTNGAANGHAGGDKPPVVFLAVPNHDGYVATVTAGALLTASARCHPLVNFECASLLAHNFNRLWVEARRQRERLGVTHFAMLHADTGPDPGWLDVLVDEQRRTGADVVSVISPMKDDRGLVSTGFMDVATWHIRRLTMFEALKLPETFTAAEAGEPGKALMVNTGCWVCDFTRPWVDEFPGFAIIDRIGRLPDGRPFAQVLSEDWNASRWWHERGLDVRATRKVKLSHVGPIPFRNDQPWGRCRTDPGEQVQDYASAADPAPGEPGAPGVAVAEPTPALALAS